ncbi:hypothetical protein [Nitrosovibrio sp. Nv4]|uniref:hypothetical protein n=1 Tax=Nitrosovibrio sp. Nv4 TaxID=1945880 RepID=UPI000BCE4753|nr:hypothetical protein [Nitrosovibrio sp. Nv4]SOD41692.1 hypothetical protein SAMN06298226_1994 [Nitrosovibrio sp. Nv4]
MEKKKAPPKGHTGKGKEPKPVRKPSDSTGNPDTSVLENYSPTEGAQSHPDWVKKKFPTYLAPHGKHEATSVRELTHNGHTIKIITTYRVEVDGKPADMHLSVDEDGQVFTHATPFVTYASAVDLMKQVMDAYPDAFSESDSHPDQGHDRDHSHGGGNQ